MLTYKLTEIYRTYKDKYRMHYVNKIVSEDINIAWLNIKKVFSKSKNIFRGPAGFWGETYPGLDILIQFIKKFDHQAEAFLVQGLLDKDPYIVGYSLVGLSIMKSPVLSNLPSSLLKRQETVKWSLGPFVGTQDKLSTFAKYYQHQVQT